jgi:hypothetical protein
MGGRVATIVADNFGDTYLPPPTERREKYRFRRIIRDVWKSQGSQRVLDIFTSDELDWVIGENPHGNFRDVCASIAGLIAEEYHSTFDQNEAELLKLLAERWWDNDYNPPKQTQREESELLRNAIKKVKTS